MRILLHADVDLSLPGGVETHIRELGRELLARGHEVEIGARPNHYPPFTMVSRAEPSYVSVAVLPLRSAIESRRPGTLPEPVGQEKTLFSPLRKAMV